MRLSIIGNCGSGKSTLAHAISEKYNIPHIHIDRFWFEAGGHLPEHKDAEGKQRVNARIQERVEASIAQDSWVADGWYRRAQPAITEKADQIIFLDIPLWRRLMNHMRRVLFAKRHHELRRWDDFLFSYQIIRRTFTQGPQMEEYASRHRDKIVRIRSRQEADEYVKNLKPAT